MVVHNIDYENFLRAIFLRNRLDQPADALRRSYDHPSAGTCLNREWSALRKKTLRPLQRGNRDRSFLEKRSLHHPKTVAKALSFRIGLRTNRPQSNACSTNSSG
jgi:hypothetical protein